MSSSSLNLAGSMSETNLVCPITLEVMRDPVVAADGHTYEREAILKWFSSGSTKSPSTGAALASQTLLPNHRLRAIIYESGLSPSSSSTSLAPSSSTNLLQRTTSFDSPALVAQSDSSSSLASAPAMSRTGSTFEADGAQQPPQLMPHLRELVRSTRFFDEYLEQRDQLEGLLVFLFDAHMPLSNELRTESMLLRLASALMSRARVSDALRVLTEAGQLPGASYVPRMWQAVAHVISSDYTAALELLRVLLVEVPEASPDYALLQGLVATASNDAETAAALFAKGIADAHMLHRDLAINGDSRAATSPAVQHYRTENLAWLYHLHSAEVGDDNQALEDMYAAQQLGFSRRATLFRNMALTLMRMGRYSEALTYIDWSLEIVDKEPLSWEHKANILTRLDRSNEAVECWTRVIQLKPGCVDPLVTRATVWQDADRGIQDCLQALRIDPDSLYAKAMLVALYLDARRYREAQDAADLFIAGRAAANTAPTANDLHIRNGRAHARLFLGNFDGAIEDLRFLHAHGRFTGEEMKEFEELCGLLANVWKTRVIDDTVKEKLRMALTTSNAGLRQLLLPATLTLTGEREAVGIALVLTVASRTMLDIRTLAAAVPRCTALVRAIRAQNSNRVVVRDLHTRLVNIIG